MEKIVNVSDTAHPKMSARYKLVQTNTLAKKFKDLGFVVDQVIQKRTRKNNAAFSKHMVRLSHPTLLKSNANHDVKLQIIITNSFDGTAAFKMQLGFLRLVCSNGLIVGESFERFTHRHVGGIIEKIDDSIERIVAVTARLEETLLKMKEKKLSVAEVVSFEREAMKLRSDKIESIDWTTRRVEDEGNDLFTVFNRVQEDLVRGGASVSSAQGRTRKLREIKSVDKLRELNEKLFDLAMRYTEAQAA